MGIVRYSRDGNRFQPGYLCDGRIIDISEYFGEETPFGTEGLSSILKRVLSNGQETEVYPRTDVSLASPVSPRSVVRLDGCYEHDLTDEGFNPLVEAAGFNEQNWPSLWVAPPSTLAGPDNRVQIPPQADDIRVGVELGLVVGDSVTPETENPLDAIVGATVCTSIRIQDDIPGLEGYKMFDNCLPCGPAVAPANSLDFRSLTLGVRVDDDPVDTRTTGEWRFSLSELVSYATDCLSLSAGDLITTGNPVRNSPAVDAGDTITAWVEGIGSITTTLTRGTAQSTEEQA